MNSVTPEQLQSSDEVKAAYDTSNFMVRKATGTRIDEVLPNILLLIHLQIQEPKSLSSNAI